MQRFHVPVAAFVLLRAQDTVLLQRRSGTGFADGQYCPPGGHLEPGESISQAAIRECYEEIGIQIERRQLIPIGVTPYASPAGGGVDFFFSCEEWRGIPQPLAGCDEVSWWPLSALPDTTIPFIRRAIERHLIARHWFDEAGWE
jgi:8-oxo-dGTP diphosphatase